MMQVTIRVGQCEESFEVRSDLLAAPSSPLNDARQDRAVAEVGAAFTTAYKREIERAADAASGQPPLYAVGELIVPDQLAINAGWADGLPIPGWADSPVIRYASSVGP